MEPSWETGQEHPLKKAIDFTQGKQFLGVGLAPRLVKVLQAGQPGLEVDFAKKIRTRAEEGVPFGIGIRNDSGSHALTVVGYKHKTGDMYSHTFYVLDSNLPQEIQELQLEISQPGFRTLPARWYYRPWANAQEREQNAKTPESIKSEQDARIAEWKEAREISRNEKPGYVYYNHFGNRWVRVAPKRLSYFDNLKVQMLLQPPVVGGEVFLTIPNVSTEELMEGIKHFSKVVLTYPTHGAACPKLPFDLNESTMRPDAKFLNLDFDKSTHQRKIIEDQ